jgi:hypothetical protein
VPKPELYLTLITVPPASSRYSAASALLTSHGGCQPSSTAAMPAQAKSPRSARQLLSSAFYEGDGLTSASTLASNGNW